MANICALKLAFWKNSDDLYDSDVTFVIFNFKGAKWN